jgi:hypothetical protein
MAADEGAKDADVRGVMDEVEDASADEPFREAS